MPSVNIPSSGVVLKGDDITKPIPARPQAFRLTLANNVIEDMIKSAKGGQVIKLSLGDFPILQYGSKSQHLAVSEEDNIPAELYRTELTNSSEDEIANPHFITIPSKMHLVPTTRRNMTNAAKAAMAKEVADPAIEALKAGMSEELSKKSTSAIYVEKPAIKKRATKPASSTARLLAQNKKTFASDASRSVPASPALINAGSPSQGQGTSSVKASQIKAEKDKDVRTPILHYLAVDKAKEQEIWDFFTSRSGHTRQDFNIALEKVADYDTISQTWSLRPKNFKELDPWAFEYASNKDREQAIDHAIKAFDKMRLGTSEPEWQKLLPESDRGQGKVLSRLTAKIAEKSARNETEVDEDRLPGDGLVGKNGEAMSRSASSGSATKTKKMTEMEAQAKRLLGKPGKTKATGKASPAPRTSTVKKLAAKKEDPGRVKSSQFVKESDEEDDRSTEVTKKGPAPAKPAASKPAPSKSARPAVKPAVKRARPEDNTEAKTIQPAAKKAKRDEGPSTQVPVPKNRASNAGQPRSTAPSKSSPLASSPPTNASDIEEEPYHPSSSTSPYTSNLKRKATGDIGARAAKKPVNGKEKDSLSSTSPSSVNGSASAGRQVPTEVLDMADRFRALYGRYVELYRKLDACPNPPGKEVEELLDMHSNLEGMKKNICDAVRQSAGSQ